MTVELSRSLLGEVSDLAERAAAVILEIYESDFAVELKSDGSPVTEADLQADALICAGLAELYPDLPVVSEEGSGERLRETPPWYWLVDPLDGTRGFTNRNGDFAINIALVRDSEAVAGVVHWPLRGVCYSGGRGLPAVRRERDGSTTRIKTRASNEGPLTIAASRSRNNPLTREFVEQLEPCEVVRKGSAIKSCLVAEGAADLYPAFSETWYWDTAAPQALLEAAGGELTDMWLKPLRYDLAAGLLNPRFIAFGADPSRWQDKLPKAAFTNWS